MEQDQNSSYSFHFSMLGIVEVRAPTYVEARAIASAALDSGAWDFEVPALDGKQVLVVTATADDGGLFLYHDQPVPSDA